MKFETDTFWKHEKFMDVFFKVASIRPDDNNKDILLNGSYCTQGTATWWFTVDATIRVTPDEYHKWHSYSPVEKTINSGVK